MYANKKENPSPMGTAKGNGNICQQVNIDLGHNKVFDTTVLHKFPFVFSECRLCEYFRMNRDFSNMWCKKDLIAPRPKSKYPNLIVLHGCNTFVLRYKLQKHCENCTRDKGCMEICKDVIQHAMVV